MPSTYTTRNRLEKQAAGENNNTWGDRFNDNVTTLVDEALDGVVAFTLSGSKTLTEFEAASDEARKRVLHVTGGTGGTITIPNKEKVYLVRNASSGSVIITTGSGTTATLLTGTSAWVFSTGSNQVYAASSSDFGTATVEAGGFLADGTAGVGYTTGAGGTVTQATSKSTNVTLNKPSGTITTHNAALAANTTVSFLLTNSTIGANDNVVVSIQDGISNTRYSTRVGSISPVGGDVSIMLKNETAGSLSDAVKIRFTVLKGAAS